jgi:hypothetical protein
MSSDSDDDEYPEELFNWQELPRSLPLGLDNDENPKEIGASWHQWCCQYPDGHHEEISRFTHLELLLLPPLVPNPPPSPQNNNIKTLGPVARFPKALSRRLILKSGTISYEQQSRSLAARRRLRGTCRFQLSLSSFLLPTTSTSSNIRRRRTGPTNRSTALISSSDVLDSSSCSDTWDRIRSCSVRQGISIISWLGYFGLRGLFCTRPLS